MDKIFDSEAKEILTLLDPEGRRKKREPRPFMVELFGTSNSGKTTLLDAIYVFFKAVGFETAKCPEGAEAVPPQSIAHVQFHDRRLRDKSGAQDVFGQKHSSCSF